MKFNFRKVASVIASVVMLGSTIGIAAAASYPAPFISGGVANVGVVVGSSAAYSDWSASLDLAQNLQYELAKQTATAGTATGASASGGDSYKIEKTSTKFHLGDAITTVVSGSVSDDNLPTLLADGKFVDDDNDEFDFTQKIVLNANNVTMFEDNDYKADEPTIGMKINSGAGVMNYTLDFSDKPLWSDLETADMTILGRTYYVLDAVANTTLTLLDAAETITLAEGETKTLSVGGKDYIVTPSIFGSTTVKLSVNGEVTNSLSAAQTYKLSDGAYVGIKDIVVQNYAGGAKQVEFSIGSGKLKLVSGSDVEMNDVSITGLGVTITAGASTSGDTLDTIKLAWLADDDLFVTADRAEEMPGFKAVKYTSGGMTFPTEEVIAVTPDSDTSFKLDDFPLKDTVADIAFLYGNESAFVGLGKDNSSRLVTSNKSNLYFDANNDAYFVASYASGADAESYLMKATAFVTESSTDKVTIQYMKDGSWTDLGTKLAANDTVSKGSVDLIVSIVTNANNSVQINTTTSGVNFHTLYSKAGLKVYLPFSELAVGRAAGSINLTNASGVDTYSLIFSEEDKDGNKGLGSNITLVLNEDTNGDTSVTSITATPTTGTSTEILNTDVYRNFAYSALATETLLDKSATQQKATLKYHGDESYFNMFLAAPAVAITPGSGASTGSVSALGSVTVSDAEFSKVSSKNVIVVGGSCINSVAATLVGGAKCSADFTTATGVAAGQFLIQSFANPNAADKVALVVAGYDAADTVNAVKYLTTQSPDATVGKKYKGTTATSATLV